MKIRVVNSTQADADIYQALESEGLNDEARSERLNDALHATYDLLAEYPKFGHLFDEDDPDGTYVFLVDGFRDYRVFYRILDQGGLREVTIARVLHTSRDLGRLL